MIQPTDLRNEVRDYLVGGASKSLLLIGKKETGILKDAMKVASFLLQSESPELCQDYMYVGLDEGEKSLGVDVAESVTVRGMLLPAVAEKQVILIDSFNTMVVQAQNKLLKLLEESVTTVVIAVAYEDSVLPTIKSRMTVVRYMPQSLQEYEAYCLGKGIASPLAMFYLTGGYVGCQPNPDILKIFESVHKSLSTGFEGVPEVMTTLHIAKEGDKQSFFEIYKGYAARMLSLVVHSIMQAEGMTERVEQMVTVYENEITRMSTPYFTKDDFFNFFVQIA
jgi:hypothetical protein